MFISNNKIRRFVHIQLRFFFFIALLKLLAACSVIDVQKGASFPSSGRWVVLPFQNYSQAPRAGEQVEEMLVTLFRIKGVSDIEMYPQQDEDRSGWLEFNDRRRQERALVQANKQNFSYAVTGSVEEWQYKLGVGSEPVVGLTIRVMEVATGKVVWSASGSRSGWSTGSLSGTAQKLLNDLISGIEITKL